jgi:hypothetical protein
MSTFHMGILSCESMIESFCVTANAIAYRLKQYARFSLKKRESPPRSNLDLSQAQKLLLQILNYHAAYGEDEL